MPVLINFEIKKPAFVGGGLYADSILISQFHLQAVQI